MSRLARTVVLLVLATSVVLAGCGDDDDDGGAADTTSEATTGEQVPQEGDEAALSTVTLADDGGEVELEVGQRVEVILEVAGGTGYEWRFPGFQDDSVLRLVSTERRPATAPEEGEQPMTGAPEHDVFLFEAIGEGSMSLTFGLFGPTGDEPEESFTITAVVGS